MLNPLDIQIRKFESAYRGRSALITGGFVALLFLALWFLTAIIIKNPPDPPEVAEYQVVGSIDFGDLSEGNQQVNTMDQSSPNPSPNNPTPARANRSTHSARVSNTLTGNEATGHPAQASSEPADNPGPTDQVSDPMTFENGGGANEGVGGDVGNQGVPGAPLTDGDGLEWGTGKAGLRVKKGFVKPPYDRNEEGVMSFRLTITKSGYVKDVTTVKFCACPRMNRALITQLKKMEFYPISEERQLVVTFRLRQTD